LFLAFLIHKGIGQQRLFFFNYSKINNKLILSPDARFLVFWGKVLPLDGTEIFRYTERFTDVSEVAVSPNGRYIAHGENAVWLQPVSPETLRPAGPAKKLSTWRRTLGKQERTEALTGRGTHRLSFSVPMTRKAGHTSTPFRRRSASRQYPDAASTGLPSGWKVHCFDYPREDSGSNRLATVPHECCARRGRAQCVGQRWAVADRSSILGGAIRAATLRVRSLISGRRNVE
jgi:hypothetical protein